jgi:nucleoporin NUP159
MVKYVSTTCYNIVLTTEDTCPELSCSPLSHLHSVFATSPGAGVDEINFTPQRTLTISPATPNFLVIACNDTRLLIGSTQGPIAMYDCSQLFTAGTNEIAPMHTFSGTRPCEQIAPNPGDIPELVAVLRQGEGSAGSVELLNLQTLQITGGWISGGTPDTTPSARKYFQLLAVFSF